MHILRTKIRWVLFSFLIPIFICWLIFRLGSFLIHPTNSVKNSLIAYGCYLLLIFISFIGSYILATTEKKRSWGVRFFFAVVSCILFLPIMIVVAPIGAILIALGPKSNDSKWGCTITSLLALVSMFAACLFVRQKGNVKAFREAKKPVVVFNHRGSADYFIAGFVGLFKNWRVMIGANLWSWRIFHWFFNTVGVPIPRDTAKEEQKLEAIEISKAFLSAEEDTMLEVFPEGTRNRTEQPLLKFFGGAFRIACDLELDVYPVIFIGAEKWREPGKQNKASFVKKKGIRVKSRFKQILNLIKRIFRHGINPTIVEIYYLDPISSKGKNYKQLNKEVYEVMWDAYVKYSKKH